MYVQVNGEEATISLSVEELLHIATGASNAAVVMATEAYLRGELDEAVFDCLQEFARAVVMKVDVETQVEYVVAEHAGHEGDDFDKLRKSAREEIEAIRAKRA